MHIRNDPTPPESGPAGGEASDGSDEAELAARRRLGSALRSLMHGLVGHAIPLATLESLTSRVASCTADLDGLPTRSRPVSTFSAFTASRTPAEGERLDAGYDDRPFGGWSSPLSLEMDIVRTGDTVVTEVVLGSAHEGAPGRSHGGIVAALFDDLTGFVLQIAATPGYTGELKVRYEAPVPLNEPLVARAWLRERDGRKLFIDGDLTHGERRVARVEATYIAIEAF